MVGRPLSLSFRKDLAATLWPSLYGRASSDGCVSIDGHGHCNAVSKSGQVRGAHALRQHNVAAERPCQSDPPSSDMTVTRCTAKDWRVEGIERWWGYGGRTY